jgi:hypothetical protein
MRTTGLFLLFLLCTLAELACRATLLACGDLDKCIAGLEKTKRRLCAGYLRMKRIKANRVPSPGKAALQAVSLPAADSGVVGRSRTVFITELPAFRSRQEIKPFKSEPLVMAPQGDFEEEEPGGYDAGTAPVGEDELDDFEPDSGDGWPEGSSSGVSFEELSETAGILAQEEPSAVEKQKAVAVLEAVDGTELFNFIAINEVYTQKAKALMAAFREQPEGDGSEVFDMGKYME